MQSYPSSRRANSTRISGILTKFYKMAKVKMSRKESKSAGKNLNWRDFMPDWAVVALRLQHMGLKFVSRV